MKDPHHAKRRRGGGRAHTLLFATFAAGCTSVTSPPFIDARAGKSDSDPQDGGPPCGERGQACCAGSCNLRASCDGVACIAADVWASGLDGTANFNGGSWTHPLLTGTTLPLPAVNGLWGTTALFIVGVGQDGLILRRDSTGWHRDMPATPGTGTFYAVAGSGATDVWAVGDAHFSHYNGIGWLDVTPPYTNEPFYAVWLSGPGEGWATGSSGILARLSGGVWTQISRQGNAYDKYGLWGSAANDVWKVGARHTLIGQPLEIDHFDGTTWSRVTVASQGDLPPLKAVWGSDATHVWAVGDQGTIVFWNGTLWNPVLSGTTDDLSAVWGSGLRDVWVAGTSGVRHYNGTTWAPIGTLTSPPVALWLSPE
jgi:hypothetical protein